MKTCKTCEVILTEGNWFPSFQKSYNYQCKSCTAAKNKKYRKERGQDWLDYRKEYAKGRKKKHRCYNLRQNYGISLEEWEKMFSGQGCKCKICGTEKEPSMGWHTDHCHQSGEIRGILCHACNTGLGKFKDDIETLEKAINYLNRKI